VPGLRCRYSSSTPARASSTKATGTSHRQALLVLCASQLMIILDGTIVAVALPAIQSDLDFSRAGLAWVVNAYLVAFGGLLLLGGRLGDLFGRRRVLLTGLAAFTIASLACGLASSGSVLVAARFAQGVGGALAASVALAMIITTFSDPGERGKALGVFSFVGAAGASIGLIAGGVLTQTLSWHWVFLVNVPPGIAACIGIVRFVPADPGKGGRADVLGALLATSGLMIAVYSLVTAADAGRSRTRTLLLGATAVILLTGFIARQATTRNPLLPLRLLRSRAVAVGNAVQTLMIAGLFGFQFLGVLYLQRVLGYSPTKTGLAYLPTAVVIAAVSLAITTRLVGRIGHRPVVLVGLAAITLGLTLLARVPIDGHYLIDVLPAALLLGVGFGLAFPALATIAVSSAAQADAGIASGLFNATQQLGGAFGLGLLATLAANRSNHSAQPNTSTALLSGYHLAFVAAAILVTIALLITLAATTTSAAGTRDDKG
jgi:EmrB/QacA subfamily drug resistance transporter